jgi:hypothetical protein
MTFRWMTFFLREVRWQVKIGVLLGAPVARNTRTAWGLHVLIVVNKNEHTPRW